MVRYAQEGLLRPTLNGIVLLASTAPVVAANTLPSDTRNDARSKAGKQAACWTTPHLSPFFVYFMLFILPIQAYILDMADPNDQPHRKRARQACLACNSRRVKCNVVEERPCANCKNSNVPCET